MAVKVTSPENVNLVNLLHQVATSERRAMFQKLTGVLRQIAGGESFEVEIEDRDLLNDFLAAASAAGESLHAAAKEVAVRAREDAEREARRSPDGRIPPAEPN